MPRVAIRLNILSVAIALAFAGGAALAWTATRSLALALGVGLMGIVAAAAPRVARQWERAVVRRLGRFVGLRGPGLFWVVPFVDTVSSWVDQRTVTTSFAAEQTLTKDTVPVNVDAVLFWLVHDVERAALEVMEIL